MSAFPSSKVLVITLSDNLVWPIIRGLWLAGAKPFILGNRSLSVLSLMKECVHYDSFQSVVRDERNDLSLSMMEDVSRIIRQHEIDLVMAADVDSTHLLARWARENKDGKYASATPEPDIVKRLHDKWQLSRLLNELEIPYPKSELAHTEQEVLATRLSFPIITKPLDAASSIGFQIHNTPKELEGTITNGELYQGFPLIVQELVQGWDIGYSFLADHGKILVSALCEHKKRGVRTYFRDDRMDRFIQRLLDSTSYSGVGHIDARYDPQQDEYRILELNPRFWASILYAANAGINFPECLLRHSTGQPIARTTPDAKRIRLPVYEEAVTLAVRAVERYHEWKHGWGQ